MPISSKLKEKVISKLLLGKASKLIAKECKIKYQTVLQIREEINKDAEAGKIVDIANVENLNMIHDVVTNSDLPSVNKMQILDTVDKASGLQLLDKRFQKTVNAMLDRAERFAKDENTTPTELVDLIKATTSGYKDMFGKSGININMGDNGNITNQTLNQFRKNLA